MKILWTDIVIIMALLFYFGSGVATKYLVVSMSGLSDAATYIESNPLMRAALNVSYLINAIQIVVIAFLGGIYWLLRRRYVAKPEIVSLQLLQFYTITLCLIFAQYFLNDVPIALKIFMGG